MVRERAGRRQRVLDGRQLLDLLRRPRPVPVVEVVSEKVLVILIVPGVRLVGLLLRLGFLRRRRGIDRLQLLGWNFLQHRILDHLLVQEVRELQG
jgi:hypothetical protein